MTEHQPDQMQMPVSRLEFMALQWIARTPDGDYHSDDLRPFRPAPEATPQDAFLLTAPESPLADLEEVLEAGAFLQVFGTAEDVRLRAKTFRQIYAMSRHRARLSEAQHSAMDEAHWQSQYEQWHLEPRAVEAERVLAEAGWTWRQEKRGLNIVRADAHSRPVELRNKVARRLYRFLKPKYDAVRDDPPTVSQELRDAIAHYMSWFFKDEFIDPRSKGSIDMACR